MIIDEKELYGPDGDDFAGSFYYYKSDSNHRKYKDCKVRMFVKENCGDTPHVFLLMPTNNVCRIELLDNKYYRNGEENIEHYSLTKLEADGFNRAMHSHVYGDEKCTVWEYLIMLWDAKWRCSHQTGSWCENIDAFTSIPDYTYIKE